MRTIYAVLAGLVLAYCLGAFEVPLTLVRGSAGEVNTALAGGR